ncbi:mucin-2-like [Toxorhynchites rutilus septentrionalis]|uniref:mucin-2-like n=1 Tax=Toxorhynchites rutilus septentrionalis TaxID=329112 RepID=UPI002479ECF2|nr:mucin-2-like [Toxorhynchites rutilus septentrionalis]
MMEPRVYHLLSVVLMACLGFCDIVVNANAKAALKTNVKVDPSLSWCKVFNNQDFPPFTQCENKEDNFFDYFPACCNGAYKCRAGRVWNLYLCPPKTVSDGTSRCIELKGGVCPYNRNGSDSGITMATASTTASTKIITTVPTVPITLTTPKFSVYPNGSTTPTHPIVSVLPTDSTVATTLTELTDPATSEPTTISTHPNVSATPTDPISSKPSTIPAVSVIPTDSDLPTTPPALTVPTDSDPPTVSTMVPELTTESTTPAASAFPTDSPTSMAPTIHPDTTVPTTTIAPTAPEPICATESYGKKIAHPADCTKYIVCDGITGTAKDCYEGYIFYKPFAACLPGNKKTCERYSLGR